MAAWYVQPMVARSLAPGTSIEEFEIDRELQSGGFGVTYLALDRKLGRRVALKEYLPREWGGRNADGSVGPRSPSYEKDYQLGLMRFLEEARKLARLEEEQTRARLEPVRIVRVYRVIEARGTAYMVMEYVEGRDLEETLKEEGAWSEERVRGLLEDLLPGLTLVHRAGLTHGDIKPANVMLRSDGTPVLIDFGAARYAAAVHSHSEGSVLTRGYAPFEQYATDCKQGHQTDWEQGPWTDVYALGALAYRALSGRVPNDAKARVYTDPLVPVAEAARGEVSESFGKAVMAALAVSPEKRPQNVAEWHALWDGADSLVERVAYGAMAFVIVTGVAFGIVNWLGEGGVESTGESYSPVLGRAWSASHVGEHGWTDLHYAAVLNRPDLARLLLDAGASIDARFLADGDSERLVETLSAFEAPIGVRRAVEVFADDPARTREFAAATPMLFSIIADAGDVAELLLNRGANLEWLAALFGGSDGSYGLGILIHIAVQSDSSVEVVRLLLDRGANLEAVYEFGDTPLHAAVSGDSVGVVELLLNRGASLEVVNEFGGTPLHSAVMFGSVGVVELLLNRGANLEVVNEFESTPLHSAIMFGSVGVVELLLNRGANLEAVDDSGNTPLHSAMRFALVGVVELLLDRGADLEAAGPLGETPLYVAAFAGSVDVVELLLDRGANLEAAGDSGNTPLHAAAFGSVDVVELLLDRGADLEAAGAFGETPLHVAAFAGSVDVVELLLDRGANLEAAGDSGNTPLHAAAFGSVDVVELLLDRGADLEAADDSGNTPLHVAASGDSVDVVKLLLDRGANLAVNHFGVTPLNLANTDAVRSVLRAR